MKEGDSVKMNTPLFTIEAMKKETTITATSDTTIALTDPNEGILIVADDLVMES